VDLTSAPVDEPDDRSVQNAYLEPCGTDFEPAIERHDLGRSPRIRGAFRGPDEQRGCEAQGGNKAHACRIGLAGTTRQAVSRPIGGAPTVQPVFRLPVPLDLAVVKSMVAG
jgi:hypothetical protein